MNNTNTRGTILIVEDNKGLRENLTESLSQRHTVFAAESGAVAMDLLESHIPDLIILDIMLPFPLDGFSILRILKRTPKLNTIPVILMSALSTDDKINEGLEMGANDYIVKPFRINELLLKAKNQIDIRLNHSLEMERISFSKANSSQLMDMKTTFKSRFEQLAESVIDKEEMSVVEIAEKMMMSVSTLERWSRKIYGLPPRKYILQLKLSKAEILLRQSNCNIKDVAYALGFNSVPYFCLCFKKKFGNSPKAFTRQKQVIFFTTNQPTDPMAQ